MRVIKAAVDGSVDQRGELSVSSMCSICSVTVGTSVLLLTCFARLRLLGAVSYLFCNESAEHAQQPHLGIADGFTTVVCLFGIAIGRGFTASSWCAGITNSFGFFGHDSHSKLRFF